MDSFFARPRIDPEINARRSDAPQLPKFLPKFLMMRSGVYIVPEPFAGNHVMNRLLSGWELSAITTLASGTPSSASIINYAQ